MSADTVARWNAIPLERRPEQPTNKRSRSENDDNVIDDNSSDDNISIVSRSPSPQPDRDVQMKDIDLYDEHVRGTAREVITVETRIKSSNKGFAMLAKMGWTEGKPLGLSGDGRVDPIPFTVKQDSTGLGKYNQDFKMIETTVAQRRNLESERMQFETTEQRLQREASVAQKAAIKTEISTVLRPFYCELCDKQFQNVAQYDEHTNSYAHHHKAREKDMNANHPLRIGGREEAERRKEKERKREEKELRKLAKAAGIKLAAVPNTSTSDSIENKGDNKGFKKSSWASISSAPTQPTPSGSASSSNGGGWATVSTPAPPSVPRSSSWQAVNPPPPPPSSAPAPPPSAPAPPPSSAAGGLGFRSGGWSTLATTSTPPPPPSNSEPPPPPGPPSSLPPPPHSLNAHAPPPPPSGPPSSSWTPAPPSNRPPPHQPSRWDAKPRGNHPPEKRNDNPPEPRKGSWQNFQKMKGRR
ncbi:g patch domain containing 8 [Pyrrhoderma noxium]|uniref:G patch domain containing 8 n=1 Tax=Pyrrhoderma noxium TaxID=2282107 RepID=A0A286URS9_9AGAM|nr:g patch domain containing 8 [Pyrrhoderma noxium]